MHGRFGNADKIGRRLEWARILIGTSGWHYASWRGPFYPREVRTRTSLRDYAGMLQLDTTVELNGCSTARRRRRCVTAWRKQTGRDFVSCLEGVEVHHALENVFPVAPKTVSSR